MNSSIGAEAKSAASRGIGQVPSLTKRQQALARFKHHAEGIAALACGVMIVAAWAVGHASAAAAALLYAAAFLIGGFAKAKEGLVTLYRERDLDVNLLMIVAAVGAASIGYWSEGALLIFIFATSGALESYATERSRRDISSLMSLKPETAILYRDGTETVVPIERLEPGDIALVKPGERIPADGVVRDGVSAINQASITGESVPVDVAAGSEVFAGTLNGQGSLFVEVAKTSDSSLFARILKLVQEAQSEKPSSQLFVEKFERIYARAILAATAILIAVPPLAFGWSWSRALYQAMVFLVVASPCALVASIMPALLSAISNGARKGILVKGGAHLLHLARIRAVAFDKTGTLTSGSPAVTDVLGWNGCAENELLRAAASIESLSEHPLAGAIVRAAQSRGLLLERPAGVQAMPGSGVSAEWNGESWTIGKVSRFRREDIGEELEAAIDRLEAQGKTVTAVSRSGVVVGVIAMQDRIRERAKPAVAALKRLGVDTAMLTGDRERSARSIAGEAGVDRVFAELLPEDKLARLHELKRSYGHVAMVGDGVNDAPALAAATVGIAMGGTGSDAALETADLVLTNDKIELIPEAIALGKRARRIVNQNIVFSVSVIACLIAVNFISGIPLPLGVVGHEGSTILVILNGLRLLRR